MHVKEIVRHIDEGANFYLCFFGDAPHMEHRDTGYYRFVRPKVGEQGITFAYDVRLEKASAAEQAKRIEEIKALHMPVWWGLSLSAQLYKQIFGQEKQPSPSNPGDECYLALLPHEWKRSSQSSNVKSVTTKEDFALWASIANNVLSGGFPDIHPVHHYGWCEEKKQFCSIVYDGDEPAAVASILDNDGICSLEFVATLPGHRRKGMAKEVCTAALQEAFVRRAKIVTLRAINPGTRELYESLGFRIYNDEI